MATRESNKRSLCLGYLLWSVVPFAVCFAAPSALAQGAIRVLNSTHAKPKATKAKPDQLRQTMDQMKSYDDTYQSELDSLNRKLKTIGENDTLKERVQKQIDEIKGSRRLLAEELAQSQDVLESMKMVGPEMQTERNRHTLHLASLSKKLFDTEDTLEAAKIKHQIKEVEGSLDALSKRQPAPKVTTGGNEAQGDSAGAIHFLGSAASALTGSSATLGSAITIQAQGVYLFPEVAAIEFGLVLAPLNSDTGRSSAVSSMMLPEAGTYAFVLNAHTSLPTQLITLFQNEDYSDSITFLWLNANSYYRNVKVRDKQQFGTLQFRLALEWRVIPNGLSLYAGLNYLQVVSQINNFTSTFGSEVGQVFRYPDVGISGFVHVGDSNEKSGFWLQLQFLIGNDDLHRFRGDQDAVVPVVRVSYQQPLLWF